MEIDPCPVGYMQGAVERYINQGIPPGRFLTAVFSGAPLKEVAAAADDENRKYLFDWAVFVVNKMPSLSQGTKERFQDWIEVKGLEGIKSAAATAEKFFLEGPV